MTAIGASAGPSTATRSEAGARSATWRANSAASALSRAVTMRAARRPKGGRPPACREAISASRNASRSPEMMERITGWSGMWVCTKPRPCPNMRPARPVTWCRSWNVRSPARGSDCARPKSPSTTPTVDSSGKLWPLATIWVPMTICASPSAISRSTSRNCSMPGTRSEERIATRASGHRSRTSSAIRSTPGPHGTSASTAPHLGQPSGWGSEKPQWWQASRPRKRCSTSQAVHCGHSMR